MEAIRLTQPSVLFGYYNHAVLGHEGCFKRDLERLMRLVASGRLDLSRWISHVVSRENVARGVEQLSKKKDNPVRIVVKPGNSNLISDNFHRD